MDTMSKKVYVIGCGVFKNDLKRLAGQYGINAEFEFLDSHLHEDSQNLRNMLQSSINTAGEKDGYERIILGYGVCGKGTDGLKADNVPLVIPQAQDCIAMLLGSDEEYRRQFEKCPGTYYISPGWFDEKDSAMVNIQKYKMFGPCQDNADLIEKYGKDNAEYLAEFFGSWYKNYSRAVFIDNGTDNAKKYEKDAQDFAEKYGWKYERIKADYGLMKKLLLATKSDNDVLIVRAGEKIVFDPSTGKMVANRYK